MRLLLVGALAALAVALPTGYHRKPSANESSELHRRAAARWLNMEKRDACADLYDNELNMRTFKDGLADEWARKLLGLKGNGVVFTHDEALELWKLRDTPPHRFEEYCRELNELKDQARRLVEEKINKLRLEIEQKEQELKHLKRGDFLNERAVDEKLRQLLYNKRN